MSENYIPQARAQGGQTVDSWNENYHYLIDAMPKGIQVINRQGILVDANRAWLIYFGVSLGDVRGRHIRDVMQDMVYINPSAIDPETPATEYSSPAALETLKTGLPYSTTFNQDKMLAVARPVYQPQGQFNYVLTTITENSSSAAFAVSSAPLASAQVPPTEPSAASLLIGGSAALLELRRTIDQVAPSTASILISGETGTGKEIVATELHRCSGRGSKAFIRINCAAIPESLIESELFGYERGAFTGALSGGKAGLIEAAAGGTLFLDEINALPLAQQGKLLRVLESRSVQRVGSLKEKPVDFRLLAATNVDLARLVAQDAFRSDLYYRLNVIQLHIPPLRERPEDVIPILRHYLDLYGKQYQRTLTLSDAAAQALQRYHWPGNVRELRNLAEYLAVTVTQREVRPEHFVRRFTQADETARLAHAGPADPEPDRAMPDHSTPELDEEFSLKDYLDQCERQVLEEAFRKYSSSRRVAEVLKIDQSSVVRKKGKYGL